MIWYWFEKHRTAKVAERCCDTHQILPDLVKIVAIERFYRDTVGNAITQA